MSPEEFKKKFLEGVELKNSEQAGVEKVLRVLQSEPQVMNRAVPPAGYEDELLRALRKRLPAETAVAAPVPQRRRKDDRSWRRLWLFSPSFSWTLTGSFAVFVAVFTFSLRDRLGGNFAPHDLLTATALRAPVNDLENWVASVGDSATQIRVAQTNINAIAEAMSRDVDSEAIERALDKVAGEAGMKP